MLGHRQLSFDDYLEMLRRRRWMLLIPTVVFCGGTYLISLALPNQYTSRTLVLVEQQKVPDNYVKSVVTEDIGQRLGTMQEQILSRTRLQPIIDKFGLFKKDKNKVAMEDLVDRLRKSISVVPIQSLVTTKEGELPGFSISFTADDPRLAQQVCGEILSMFTEENLRLREQRAEGTTDFLKGQLDQAKRSLDEQDAKLAEFQRKYMGALPGNEQSDISMVTSLTSQLDAVTGQLSRAQQDLTYQESILAQQLGAWQASQSTGGGVASSGPRQDPLDQQLNASQTELALLQARYTPDYPDIVKLKASIEELKKKIDENAKQAKDKPAPTTDLPTRKEPAEIQQTRLQIHQTKTLIQEATREQARLKQQLATYQSRVSMSPAVDQQYKELTRDYQTALLFYNDLLAKKGQSEMATSLERQQQGEQFSIMDPPNLPEKPSFPNRPAFAGGGLGFGLALGVGIILLMEFRDKSLRTENDIQHFLDLPTLARIPDVEKAKSVKKPRRSQKKAAVAKTAHA
jgi:polysaccharide chain length determinant protein (PEP-CTERM system associated)